MLRTLLAFMIAALSAMPAAAISGDLGRCKPASMTGPWRLFISLRSAPPGSPTDYYCDIQVNTDGPVIGHYCTKTLSTQSTYVDITGDFHVGAKCNVRMNLTIKSPDASRATERIHFGGTVSIDRSRISGTYKSSLYDIDTEYYSRMEAVRLP
jgi:hypothetical protein